MIGIGIAMALGSTALKGLETSSAVVVGLTVRSVDASGTCGGKMGEVVNWS